MVRYLIAILFTTAFSVNWAQESSCEQFGKGKYFYNSPNGGEVEVKRKKNKQIERYNNENQRFIFKIERFSDCEYTLTLKKARGVDKELRKQIIGTKLRCEIMESDLDQFTIILLDEVKNKTVIFYKS